MKPDTNLSFQSAACVKRLIPFLLLISGILTADTLPLERVVEIRDDVTLYLPQGVDERTLPSMALLEEPDLEAAATVEPGAFAPRFEVDGTGKVAAIIDLPPDTDLYGTGEVVGPMRRNGRRIELWNMDNYIYGKVDGRRLYQSHPWVLALRPDGSAVGILFDSTWRAFLETTDEAITFASEGPAFRTLVIEKDTPQEVLSELASLTGTMPLPPRWALGYHQCKFSYYPDARVREVADEFRARNLPCDVIWMDIDYMDDFRVFTFDPKRFPDPSATNAYLHDSDFKAIWMIDPGVKLDPGYAVYESGTAADAWVEIADGEPFVGKVWPGDCVFPDYTMPSTREWWAGLYEDFMATGIDGVWNDMNEPSVFDGPGFSMNPEAWHRGGGKLPPGPHLRYHNVYGMLMVKASREGILEANPDRRPFVLTRSNFLGGQRYAATWTGDNKGTWEHLKLSVPMSITLGLSGQPLSGPDVGGFVGGGDPVLYAHWMALGAFYPFYRGHADNQVNSNEPWQFGPEAEAVARTALERRYRLLPYIYTQIEAATRDGLPLMRPAFFADPADPRLRKEQEAFLFGPDLLVIPRWANRPALPAGDWQAVSILEGNHEQDSYQPVVKIRDGAIVPLGRVVQSTEEESLDPLTLLINPDAEGNATGLLYEDDGEGFGYRYGDYARSEYVATMEDGVLVVRLAGREGEREVEPRRVVVRVVTSVGEFRGWGDPVEGIAVRIPKAVLKGMESRETGQSTIQDDDVSDAPDLNKLFEEEPATAR